MALAASCQLRQSGDEKVHTGFICTMFQEPDRASHTKTMSKPPGHSALAGKRCLILEDEFLIALDLERILESAGAAEVVSTSRIAQARDALAGDGKFDVALLDLKLDDESSDPIAATLKERGVPFVFITGMSSKGKPGTEVSQKWPGVQMLEKPFEQATLLEVLSELLGKAGK